MYTEWHFGPGSSLTGPGRRWRDKAALGARRGSTSLHCAMPFARGSPCRRVSHRGREDDGREAPSLQAMRGIGLKSKVAFLFRYKTRMNQRNNVGVRCLRLPGTALACSVLADRLAAPPSLAASGREPCGNQIFDGAIRGTLCHPWYSWDSRNFSLVTR